MNSIRNALFDQELVPYDLRTLKSLEKFSTPEVKFRNFAMFSGCFAAYWAFGYEILPAWLGVYLIWTILWQLVLYSLPDEADRPLLAIVAALFLVDTLVYSAVVYICWFLDEPIMHYIALITLYAGMINSISRRATDLVFGLGDLLAKVLANTLLPVLIFFYQGPSPEFWTFTLVLTISLVYFISSMLDLLRDKLRRREADLAEAERVRLQSLGQLTGGVAHDFNNLLTVILGNLELSREMPDSPEREELLEEIDAAAHRASELTSQLLVYSRRSSLQTQVTEVYEPVDEARKILARLLPEDVSFETKVSRHLPLIKVDRRKLETVIINLVLNGRDAMQNGGKIRLFAHSAQLGSRRDGALPRDLPNGDYVVIGVEDNGDGIPKELQERVLEPYFTTKPVGKGSGLGLPMALGFTLQSGGELRIASQPGRGTVVTLWFPALSPEDVRSEAESGAHGPEAARA